MYDDPHHLDPLDPTAAYYWSDWVCPECAEDGDALDLRGGRCPSCGAAVDRLD